MDTKEMEILNEINKLEQKYSELSKNVHIQNSGYHNPYSDQTYGSEDYYTTKGTEEELMNLSSSIQKLKEDLQRARDYPNTKLSNKPEEKYINKEELAKEAEILKKEREQREKENKRLKEEERKQTFLKVKKMYKKSQEHKFDRFVNFITGKSPNWRKIGNYNQKELDYLIATIQGETKARQRSISFIENTQSYKNQSFKERRARINNSNWNEFNTLLRKRDLLSDFVENENKRGR